MKTFLTCVLLLFSSMALAVRGDEAGRAIVEEFQTSENNDLRELAVKGILNSLFACSLFDCSQILG